MDIFNLDYGWKQMEPQRFHVFFRQDDPIDISCWAVVKKTKHIVKCVHSSWEIWYEETVVDQVPAVSLYAKHKGPIYSRKDVIICDAPEENRRVHISKEFEMFDDDSICRINLPQHNQRYGDMHFNVEVLPSLFISSGYIIGNYFCEEERPHDVIVDIGYHSIYGHKVVLALWSNYFDKLFYSHSKTEEIQPFKITGICCDAVQQLLDMCLNRREEFHNYADSFDINQIEAANFLQMNVPLELIKESKRIDYWGGDKNLMTALVLADNLNLPLLLKACERVFRCYNADKKKKFLDENKESMKKLSMNTVVGFLNETQNRDTIEELNENILPVKESEIILEPFESEVNKRQDVCLLVGDGRFKVHKEYLAFWSPFFDRLFFGNFIEKGMVEMKIKEVDPQEFSTLLRLIYPPGDVRIDDSNVEYLLKLADRFQMESVLAMCGSYLRRRVIQTKSHELIMNTLHMSDKYFLVDAQISCFEEIHDMSREDSKKFRWDYRYRLAQLSENTKNNLILSI